MASVGTARAWMAVKPHLPLIKFKSLEPSVKTVQSAKATTKESSGTSIKLSGPSTRGSGLDETQLPPKYIRKVPSQGEMEYIMRGGPE